MRKILILLMLVILLPGLEINAQDLAPLSLQDIMKFKHIEDVKISDDGKWVVHSAVPDRGDPEVNIYGTASDAFYQFEVADKPIISQDGNWVAMRKRVPLLTIENQEADDSPKTGMILLNTKSGERTIYDSIQSFNFSNDGKWLFMHCYTFLDKKEEKKYKDQSPGSRLNFLSLTDHEMYTYAFVQNFAVDSISSHLAFAVSDTTGEGNSVNVTTLERATDGAQKIHADSGIWADNLAWNNTTGDLAFLAGKKDKKGNRTDAALYYFEPGSDKASSVLSDNDMDEGWRLYYNNDLGWTKDGKGLFIGTKPEDQIVIPDEEDKDSITNIYDKEQILSDRGVDVWHWDDPYIIPNQKKRWNKEKDRVYTGIFFPSEDKFVQLADKEMPGLDRKSSTGSLLGYNELPYAKRVTWDGGYRDYYFVDVNDGKKQKIVENQQHAVNISPDGEYVVYYREGNWHLRKSDNGNVLNLTGAIEIPFMDEDWDYPADVPGYGVAGWIGKSEAVLIYDKYDLWQFNTANGVAVCLTEGYGRENHLIFRIRDLEEERDFYRKGERLFVYGYHDREKYRAIYTMKAGEQGIDLLLQEESKFTLVAKAKNADRILFTRESYEEFPDLHLTKSNFKNQKQLSTLGTQTNGFAWGRAELVDWLSLDGLEMQGILIKPGNYESGKRYPVLVYYYRFFTDRLYNFPDMAVNHRPNFPYYASNGYAIFLPDIRFDVGTPGYAATKSLVPGVQKIIEMGVADADAVALHGHSWSGYQTAFMITQTDLFACAIAGAPVSNMTSAYSGIRWGTGLARQFQYEKTQSRIGGSLWEARDKYIENSPVFFADRINTPLLIQFGDVDGAVPWYQGIELYLAMRRLEKDCVFLQYRGEDHHLKKYANKLDYTIKFKEYLDHYGKGEPAAEWIEEGVMFRGE